MVRYDPIHAEYFSFRSAFAAEEKTAEIAELLESVHAMRYVHRELVPETVAYKDFWSRYFSRKLNKFPPASSSQQSTKNGKLIMSCDQKYVMNRRWLSQRNGGGGCPKSKSAPAAKKPIADEDSDDDAPLMSKAKIPAQKQEKKLAADSESDDDKPLAAKLPPKKSAAKEVDKPKAKEAPKKCKVDSSSEDSSFGGFRFRRRCSPEEAENQRGGLKQKVRWQPIKEA